MIVCEEMMTPKAPPGWMSMFNLVATFTVFRLLAATSAQFMTTSSLQKAQPSPQQLANHSYQLRQIQGLNELQLNVSHLLISRFYYLFQEPPNTTKNLGQKEQTHLLPSSTSSDGNEQSSELETRRLIQDQRNSWSHIQGNDEESKRNHFKILNKVFSRVDLPEVYKTSRSKGGHCGLHIGCIEEIPNFPSLLKKANVSSLFTLYTRDGPKSGFKIPYDPIAHYQLQDVNTTESQLEEKLRVLALNSGVNVNNNINSHHHSHSHHHHHQVPSLQININRPQYKSQRGRQTAASWQTAARIVRSQEYPFDLAALEQSGFNSSLTTRIIVGGYFAKEDEEWIDEVVKQWLLLEPSNVIKVSWADSNRGLYHSAAYNSRIVGRQLTLFLHYLDQMFHIHLDRFHLVGHSLGAHIAGFVGADNDGKIARITGLDPAGPIFVELNASMRLDPTDAKFVDVVHTNGGTITKGALGLSIPSGHVDYYCNGGSVQPGCYFSSVTKSIMDPVERVACSHRRSYRYFIEIIKLTISELAIPDTSPAVNDHSNQLNSLNETLDLQQLVPSQQLTNRDSGELPSSVDKTNSHDASSKSSNLPRAFLFEAKHDDLVKLIQPDIVLMSNPMRRELPDLAPLKRRLEFHLLNPEFPSGKRGMYFFRTRSEAPFFASKQYALTLRTDSVIRRKIALMAKIDQTLVAEAELDEIPGVYTLAFAPNDPRILNISDESRIPQVSLMWKHRSFNLLLNQQNELHLSGLELSQLDSDLEQQPIIRYSTSQRGLTSAVSLLKSGFSGEIALARNQWYKFEGRLDKLGGNIV